jgi:hypothetical protein
VKGGNVKHHHGKDGQTAQGVKTLGSRGGLGQGS